eukprot:scaffold1146_cov399-Prasinococcus_capsulatus_cf.AAC.33
MRPSGSSQSRGHWFGCGDPEPARPAGLLLPGKGQKRPRANQGNSGICPHSHRGRADVPCRGDQCLHGPIRR